MNGVPEILGSHSLWAIVRILELALGDMATLQGGAYLAGLVLGLGLAMRPLLFRSAATSDQAPLFKAARSAEPRSAYARLAERIPDQELRERLIGEMTNSGQAASRAAAIELLLVSSIPQAAQGAATPRPAAGRSVPPPFRRAPGADA